MSKTYQATGSGTYKASKWLKAYGFKFNGSCWTGDEKAATAYRNRGGHAGVKVELLSGDNDFVTQDNGNSELNS